ncbi:MAG: penicillin-binding protein 1C, partial [Moritella sp.]
MLKKSLITAVLLIAGLLLFDKLNPLPDPLSSPSLVVTAQDGQVLRRFSNSDGILREQISLDQVSPFYLQSLLAYEDKWFYYHPGINPFSLVRAAWQWFRQGQVISGGSTITMQVARLLNPHQRTILGKAKQMLRALQLEYHLDKQQILTLYINLAPFGGNI